MNEKRTTIIKLTNKEDKEKIRDYFYKYRHFENMLLILIKNNYNLYKEEKDTNDFNYLADYSVMRAVLRSTEGGKHKEKADYVKEKYKDNQIMKDLITLSEELKIHNLSMIIRRVKGQFKRFFKTVKTDKTSRPPKPKKLSNLVEYSISLDQISWSLKKENLLGVNLSDKMFYIYLKQDKLINIVKDLKNINSLTVCLSNNDIYLHFTYNYLREEKQIVTEEKLSALDGGITNLASIFIDDEKTKSLIISGETFKIYNCDFNRQIGKLNNSIDLLKNELKEKEILEKVKRLDYLKKFRSFLYEKRNRFFRDQFHKMSKRILEYLYFNNVTDLIISRNLSELKNNGTVNLGKSNNQKFIQIPIIKLLDYLTYKAIDYNIRIHNIDEAYSSKTSCLSDDVCKIQENPALANDINGYRAKRGLFKDTLLNKIWNCDLNGAVNYIKIFKKKSMDYLTFLWEKLCNPIKLKGDWELVNLIKLINTEKDKVSFWLTTSCSRKLISRYLYL
jgi:IS605 OrfB family transposase